MIVPLTDTPIDFASARDHWAAKWRSRDISDREVLKRLELADRNVERISDHERHWSSQHLEPTTRPRRNDWYDRLNQVCDQYADRRFKVATDTCFTFVVDVLDAMIGTSCRSAHQSVYGDNSRFRPYVDGLARGDFFDAVGRRTTSDQVRKGDLVQIELQHGLSVQYHWGIVTGPGEAVGFDTNGLRTGIITDLPFEGRAYLKCWKVG